MNASASAAHGGGSTAHTIMRSCGHAVMRSCGHAIMAEMTSGLAGVRPLIHIHGAPRSCEASHTEQRGTHGA